MIGKGQMRNILSVNGGGGGVKYPRFLGDWDSF